MLNLKKVIALVCVFALALTTVAFGATYADVPEDSAYYEAVETLTKLGIAEGTGNGFEPEAGVTRAQMAAFIARIQGYGETAKANATTPFADVPADYWASGYIANAAGMGIINGYGDGNFGPEDPVKYEQAVKMIMATLGYTPFAEKNGGYPTGYLAAAQRYDVSFDVANAAVGSDANRGTIAQLLAQAIDTPLMVQSKWNTNGEVEYVIADGKSYDYKTLMSENLGYVKIRGVVTENTTTDVDNAAKEINTDETAVVVIDVKDNYDTNNKKFLFGEEGYAGVTKFIVGESDAEDYLGQSVIAYVKEVNDKFVIVSIAVDTNRNDVLEIGLDQFKSATTTEIKYFKDGADETTKVAIDEAGLKVVYNYVGGYDADDLDDIILGEASTCLYGGTLTLIDNNDSKGYDVAFVELAATGVVDEVDGDVIVLKEEVEKFGISEIEVDEDDETEVVKVLKDGEEIAISELSEFDVLSVIAVSASSKVIIAEVVSNQVVGTIASKTKSTTSSTDAAYKVADAWYDVAESAYGADALAVGDGGTFYIDKYGKIAAFNEDAALAGGASANFGYIFAGSVEEPDFGATGATVKLQMITANGAEVLTINNNATIKYWDGDSAETVKANVNEWSEVTEGALDEASVTGDSDDVIGILDDLVGAVVKYTTNAAGKLNAITAADYDDKFVVGGLTPSEDAEDLKEFDADNSRLLGAGYIDADSIVFVIADDADDCKIATVADLDDKSMYEVMASYATNKADDNDIVVLDAAGFVTAGITSGLAVITAAGESVNADDESVFELSFFVDGQEVTALTEADIATGDLPTIGDIVKVKLNAAGVVTSLKKVYNFTADIRTEAGLMDTVDTTGAYVADGTTEVITGGKVVTYKKSSSLAQFAVDGPQYKLSQAKNTYVIDFTTKGAKVAKTGSYKYISKIYDEGATGNLDLYNNDELVASNKSVSDAMAYADYVYVRTYENKVVDVVIVRGIDAAKTYVAPTP